MKIQRCVVPILAITLAAAHFAVAASNPGGVVTTQMVVTVMPDANGVRPDNLAAGELTVTQGKTPARVIELQRMAGVLADMQLYILLDDSTPSSSIGLQLLDLKAALTSLPASTQVAIGYMRNGTAAIAQPFTADHGKAASALRLPLGVPGENGSPYFALTDLVQHWPSKDPTNRRAVLMLTDGVDRYYGAEIVDDPYVDTAIRDALKQGVMVYSIYFRGAGQYGRSGWQTNFAQSRLLEVSEQTGGYAYFQGFADPVTIAPFLKDIQDRLDHQYKAAVEVTSEKGVQPVKVHSEMPGLKIDAPTRIYVR